MQAEYATGSKAPELTFGKSNVGYAQVRSTLTFDLRVRITYFVSNRPNVLSCKAL